MPPRYGRGGGGGGGRGGGRGGGGGRGQPQARGNPAVGSLIEFMSSIGSMQMQVDSTELKNVLLYQEGVVKQFIEDDSVQSILINKKPRDGIIIISAWLKAPSDADIKNSFSFTKKDGLRPDPSQFWGLSLTTMMGVPAGMPVLSEEDTLKKRREHGSEPEPPKEKPPVLVKSVSAPVFDDNGDGDGGTTPSAAPIPKKPEFEGTWADDSDDDNMDFSAPNFPVPVPQSNMAPRRSPMRSYSEPVLPDPEMLEGGALTAQQSGGDGQNAQKKALHVEVVP